MGAWTWLGENSKELGAVGSIVFGLLGVAAALLAYRLNYRNNYGWRPLILPISTTLRTDGERRIGVTFEFWNRRKYPVVIRSVRVVWGWTLAYTGDEEVVAHQEWYVARSGDLQLWKAERVEPNTYSEQTATASIYPEARLQDPDIIVSYFDPRKGKAMSIASRGETWREHVRRVGLFPALKALRKGEPRWWVWTSARHWKRIRPSTQLVDSPH